MYTIFAQPKYPMGAPQVRPIGYELFIKEWRNGQWVQPLAFEGIGVMTMNHLLRQTIAQMPAEIKILSFNLEQSQFIDPAFPAMIAGIQAGTDIQLYTELTERLGEGVTSSQLLNAAKRFATCGLKVCIDDVGTGQNSPALVMMLNDYISEYKFAFQNFRPLHSVNELSPQLKFWCDMAKKYHKMLAWEGIETSVELALLEAAYPGDLLQGYLFGKQHRIDQVMYEPKKISGE